MKTIIGIDPGVTGAVSIFCGGAFLRVYDFSHIRDTTKSKKRMDVFDLVAKLNELVAYAGFPHELIVYLEQGQSMPGQGVSSTFNYGRTCGIIEGVLAGLCVTNVKKIMPVVWKRRLNLLSNAKPKDAGLQKARTLYPSAPLKLAKHHNRADAILIGHYGCLMEGML